jgi:DNA-binding beta-propeller fold protein YncE
VGALCFNPAPPKVYAVAGDTVYAVNASTDSIVARLHFTRLVANLAGDPARARIFCACENHWTSIDCATDTVLLDVGTGAPAFWAYDGMRDRLYMTFSAIYPAVEFYDASSGQELAGVQVDGLPSGMTWCPGLDRLHTLPQRGPSDDFQSCFLAAVDCAAESVAGIVPLTMFAGQITLDTVRNRLYFVYPTCAAGCVAAVDCSRNVVTWYQYAGVWTSAICYNPNNDRLYWSTYDEEAGLSTIAVYDCAAESVVKVIPVGGEVWAFEFHRKLNKLFVYGDGSPYCTVTIIDCKYDTVLARIPLAADHGPRKSFLVPEDNRFWYLGGYDVVVVDCEGDTIVAHVTDHLGSMDDAGVCRLERKIYTPYRQVIDMDDPAHVETIPGVGGSRFLYVPDQHELYSAWNYSYPMPHSDIHVLDTRTDTVDAVFTGPCQVSGMCLDRTGRYIYCAGYEDTAVFVIDTHAESVVAVINVPITAAAYEPLAVNRQTNRIYEAEYWGTPDGWIPVIRDSMPIGLEELRPTGSPPRTCQAIIRRGVPLAAVRSANLYDASGRAVAALRPGPNDISHLAPGVYFVREELQVAGRTPEAVRKIVIAK